MAQKKAATNGKVAGEAKKAKENSVKKKANGTKTNGNG
jgi:hypothetical protein